MIIHDMEGQIELGDTFKNPKFRKGNRLQSFDRVVANPMWNQDWWKEADYDADEFDRFPKGRGLSGGQGRLGMGADHPRQPQVTGTRRRSAGHWGDLARLGQREHEQGKGSAPLVRRAGPHRWRDLPARKSFLQHHRSRRHPRAGQGEAEGARGKLFLLNATNEFTKGDPKNYLTDQAIVRIADIFQAWKEVEKYSRVVSREDIAKTDFNISPSRYIHTGEGKEYRPIAEIVEELETIEEEAGMTDAALKKVLAAVCAH